LVFDLRDSLPKPDTNFQRSKVMTVSRPRKTLLVASGVVPAVVGAFFASAAVASVELLPEAQPLAGVQLAACNPCAAKNPCNPCAAKNPCNPCAAANPCNPCAAANPCNPCAAANPCNPCAAANPCKATN
jgi:hypothetical protein